MTSNIYLFSYETDHKMVLDCLDDRFKMLYDTKQISSNTHLIKTEDDITILEKILLDCLKDNGRYLLVEIADQPISNINPISDQIKRWMDNI